LIVVGLLSIPRNVRWGRGSKRICRIHVRDEIKRPLETGFMEKAQAISCRQAGSQVGRRKDVIIDEIDDGSRHLPHQGRRAEIDGNLFIDGGFLKPERWPDR